MPKGHSLTRVDRQHGRRTSKQRAHTDRQRQETLALARAKRFHLQHANAGLPTVSWWATTSRAEWNATVETEAKRMHGSRFGQLKGNLPAAE